MFSDVDIQAMKIAYNIPFREWLADRPTPVVWSGEAVQMRLTDSDPGS